MNDVLQSLAESATPTGGKPFQGTSMSAMKRRAERNRGTLYSAEHQDQVIRMSDRRYVVKPNGSFLCVARADRNPRRRAA